MPMVSSKSNAQRLAAMLLAETWTEESLCKGLRRALGSLAPRSQVNLVREVLASSTTEYPPSPRHLGQLIEKSRHFATIEEVFQRHAREIPLTLQPPCFAPAEPFVGLSIPHIATAGDLAAWLDMSIAQLDWLADTRRQQKRAHVAPLQHYVCTFVPKSDGRPRLLEAPKSRLKVIQRRILREILDAVPVHPAAHGFVRGRSSITGASIHASEELVLTLDIANFFSAVGQNRVHALFRALGYPWSVARLLTSLCTTVTPLSVLTSPDVARMDWHARNLLVGPHLAQGAPTSPALANLLCWRMDQRLSGLANRFDAAYSRYADDLAFSGGASFAGQASSFANAVHDIVRDEGFALNHRKTRRMYRQN